MFLQTSLATRRQFLERSMLGFGSAFILPSLLASCTDHRIPPDGPTGGAVLFPPLRDGDIDWNDDAKILVTTALSFIPEGGEILSAMVDIFWPSSGGNTWDQVRAQVEALIDQKIADDVYGRVSANLDGLRNVITNYVNAINNQGDVKTNWIDLRNDFSLYQPNFQQKGDEVLLLPLFGQFANMYLATLRDAVVHGSEWGLASGDVQQAQTDLTQKISEFTTYTTNTYTTGLTNLQKNGPPADDIKNEPFKTINTYNRQMTLWVLDFMDTWPYYDISKYPSGGTVQFTREIYSDPFGNTYRSSGTPQYITLPQPATQRPTNITVWGGSRIDAVQLTYPAGGGPGGITQTARMGDQNGGTNLPPAGGTFTIPLDNPIIQAQVSYDYYQLKDPAQAINTMFFLYNDGTTTQQMGKSKGYYQSGVVGYNYMALSSIYIQGVVYGLENSANCIVFGFLYWTPPAATLRALAKFYITSPKEPSMAKFAQAFPKLGLSANSISDELKAARQSYWALIRKRTK